MEMPPVFSSFRMSKHGIKTAFVGPQQRIPKQIKNITSGYMLNQNYRFGQVKKDIGEIETDDKMVNRIKRDVLWKGN